MDDIECPYCRANDEYSGDSMDQDETTEWECGECKKLFLITCSYSVDYSADKADCLNNGKHEWLDTFRAPHIIGKKIKQRCVRGCQREQERAATEEEIQKELSKLKKHPYLQKITLGN